MAFTIHGRQCKRDGASCSDGVGHPAQQGDGDSHRQWKQHSYSI